MTKNKCDNCGYNHKKMGWKTCYSNPVPREDELKVMEHKSCEHVSGSTCISSMETKAIPSSSGKQDILNSPYYKKHPNSKYAKKLRKDIDSHSQNESPKKDMRGKGEALEEPAKVSSSLKPFSSWEVYFDVSEREDSEGVSMTECFENDKIKWYRADEVDKLLLQNRKYIIRALANLESKDLKIKDFDYRLKALREDIWKEFKLSFGWYDGEVEDKLIKLFDKYLGDRND